MTKNDGGGAPTQLCPLERASLSQCTTRTGTTAATRTATPATVKRKKLELITMTVVKTEQVPPPDAFLSPEHDDRDRSRNAMFLLILY